MENEGGVKNVDGRMKTANERGRMERVRERKERLRRRIQSAANTLRRQDGLLHISLLQLPLTVHSQTLSGKIYQIKTPS